MYEQQTLLDTPNVISSPALEGGPLPSGSPAFQTAPDFGLEAHPASPTQSLQSLMTARKGKAIAAIFGRYSAPSSESAALQSALASRLEARFSGDGGMKSQWTLKATVTPLRRQFCELTPAEPTTSADASIGLPTPAARDGKDISTSNAFLAARGRHSPSLATRWLMLGRPWQAISGIYCLVMGYPLVWNEAAHMGTATPSYRKSLPPSLKP